MAEGAIKSAPAAAAITACLPRLVSVASLSTLRRLHNTPQWLCEVYSQKQVSDMTIIPARFATDGIFLPPCRLLPYRRRRHQYGGEMPKVITERMPAFAIRSISRASCPGYALRRHGINSFVIVEFFLHKDGNTVSFRLSVVSFNIARSAADLQAGGEAMGWPVMVYLMFAGIEGPVWPESAGRCLIKRSLT